MRPDDSLTLTVADPTDLLHDLVDLERQARSAEDDIVATKATLKAQQERLIERLSALRQKVREVDAPPLPLFALGGPEDGVE